MVVNSKTLCDLFVLTKPIVVKRLSSLDSLVKSLNLAYLKNNQLKESISFSCATGSQSFLKDQNELRIYARKYFKYIFLHKSYLLKQSGFEENDQKVLNAIVLKETTYLKSVISDEVQLVNLFLKALCQRFDPHSVFLDANENQEWSTALSKEELSFGFDIEILENDLYKISEMIPGGAAWNSKQVEEGDVIDQIELSNGTKYLVGIDTDKVVLDAIKSKDNMSVLFYMTKVDGLKAKVLLTKTKVEVLDNIINGYIIHKDNEKYGYIKLPSFYELDATHNGSGCSSDLAREIIQLKKDNIQGLILDLRNNGGGYVYEALAIAGLFIDEGILALTQVKGDKPRYLKDPNRGTVYNGKLIVLVNQYSASASELLSGVLQKYNRAIIVGNTTFGKATMQQTLPIDSIAEINHKNSFYANVTMGKFYMINKKSHQAIGIIPDIQIPGLFDYMQIEHESKMLYYLPSDSVIKNVDVKVAAPIEIVDLKNKSIARLKQAKWQENLKQYADTLNSYICNDRDIVLSQKAVYAWEESKVNYFKKESKSIIGTFTPYVIANTTVYDSILKGHKMYAEYNQLKIDDLKKDFRLYESINILSDYIKQP